VAVVVLLLTGTAVLVVLRAQNHAATMLIEGAVARAEDVEDPAGRRLLVIRDGSHHEATAGAGTPSEKLDPPIPPDEPPAELT
jgi:hypothetical protein